jgi:hypothetical protein
MHIGIGERGGFCGGGADGGGEGGGGLGGGVGGGEGGADGGIGAHMHSLPNALTCAHPLPDTMLATGIVPSSTAVCPNAISPKSAWFGSTTR